jgi:hypothetical protein
MWRQYGPGTTRCLHSFGLQRLLAARRRWVADISHELLVLHLSSDLVAYPQALQGLQRTPGWAKHIVKVAG